MVKQRNTNTFFDFFYDICDSNRLLNLCSCRNSSAVEHFTRNEGVPGSNPGFGSKMGRFIFPSFVLESGGEPEVQLLNSRAQRLLAGYAEAQSSHKYCIAMLVNLGFGSKMGGLTIRLDPLPVSDRVYSEKYLICSALNKIH